MPNQKTEKRMVKNLRVVVTVDSTSAPKVLRVRKMKFCPRADALHGQKSDEKSCEGWRAVS